MANLHLGHSLQRAAVRLPALRSLLWRLEALLLALFWGISALLGPDRGSSMGRTLLRAVGPRFYKTHAVRRNLALAFPDETPAQIETLVRGIWGNFGAVLAEYPHLEMLVEQRLEIQSSETLQRLCQAGKPAIFVAAHLGNWELIAGAVVKAGFPVTAVYAPFQNPLLDRLVQRCRQVPGCEFVTKQDSIRPLVKRLASGKSIGFLVDQRVDSGEQVPFFGLEALTTSSPARLALRFHCDLIPIQVKRLAGARFRVIFFEPIRPSENTPEQDQALAMTRQLNALFASWIREAPEQWLCTKRRWPKTAVPLAEPATKPSGR